MLHRIARRLRYAAITDCRDQFRPRDDWGYSVEHCAGQLRIPLSGQVNAIARICWSGTICCLQRARHIYNTGNHWHARNLVSYNGWDDGVDDEGVQTACCKVQVVATLAVTTIKYTGIATCVLAYVQARMRFCR